MIDHLRDNVKVMTGYVPGEQPREDDVLKLNTNENPYPPSPHVFDAIRDALISERLRKYPEPLGTTFRRAAAEVLNVEPESILIGNGSDDILTIVTRAFVPEGGLIASPTPSYSLYRTLAEIQGARFQTIPFTEDWDLPTPWPCADANLTLIPNPNSPSGTMVPHETLGRWLDEVGGPVVLDEAYVDFAERDGLCFAREGKAIVTRTLSKSYSLAGIRFGFAVAAPDLVRELVKVKDSYNCDVLSLTAATAAIQDQEYLKEVRAKILATRARLTQQLNELGFAALPSQANFVWCTPPANDAPRIFEELKKRGILVRLMTYPGFGTGLRITVGTEQQTDRLLELLRQVV